MKKLFASMALVLTIATTVFAGTAAPVSAMSLDQTGTYNHGEFYYDADLANSTENDFSQTDFSENANLQTVTGTKHYLALRTEPEYADNNIIGRLHNGDVVDVIGPWDGNYVWVYSDDFGCCGWVNGNYLK